MIKFEKENDKRLLAENSAFRVGFGEKCAHRKIASKSKLTENIRRIEYLSDVRNRIENVFTKLCVYVCNIVSAAFNFRKAFCYEWLIEITTSAPLINLFIVNSTAIYSTKNNGKNYKISTHMK